MLSISSATALLADAANTESRDAILTHLGFSLPKRPLSQHACTKLGIPNAIITPHVAKGPGNLRALDAQIAPNASPRETLTELAKHLSHATPHLLWLATLSQPQTSTLAITTWLPSIPPQISALITNTTQIIQSDAETLSTLCAATTQLATPDTTTADTLTHARWLEILGRESITNRFYHIIEHQIHNLAQSLTPNITSASQTLALLTTSRLLFLAFLQTKGWLNHDHDFLVNQFASTLTANRNYHNHVLNPLFFGTLNTRPSQRAARAHAFGKIPFLNGGLFTRTPIESRSRHLHFSNDALGTLFDTVFTRFRFTPHEHSNLSQSAIDPEMLGKVFESLMAPPERKHAGTFYTPQPIVHKVTTSALHTALATPEIPPDVINAALQNQPVSQKDRGILLDRISSLTILDPACGSGAFLVHTLERLATLRAQLGDLRPISAIRRTLLISNIYGVDINPTAVWLCELRLWLSIVIDNPEPNAMRILPLPNLDHNIRVGDSLSVTQFPYHPNPKSARTIATLRTRYSRATGNRKKLLAKSLDHIERQHTIAHIEHSITKIKNQRKDLIHAQRSPNLFSKRSAPTTATQRKLAALKVQLRRLYATRRLTQDGGPLPFSFQTLFPDITTRGFSIILGNPPWVRLHHIDPAKRATLRHYFTTFRNAPWHEGAHHAHASLGFAAQIDLSALFLERATQLLAPNGTLALLLPAKLWRSLAGGGTRRFIANQLSLTAIEDFSNKDAIFDATTYPSLITATKHHTPATSITVHHRKSHTSWTLHNQHPENKLASLTLTHQSDSPWILLPPKTRSAFDALTNAGTPLAHTQLGRPHLGLKSGLNNAFLVHEISVNPTTKLATITNKQRTAFVESHLLRPIVKGESITRWTITPTPQRIIWTHTPANKPLGKLPHYAFQWLKHWQHQLTHRADIRNGIPWWALFRTYAAQSHLYRVVWADFGRSPKATCLQPGDTTIPLNTCYIIATPSCDDAYTLTALLNSPLMAAWLNTIAEPARNHYHRYLGWTIALLPIPTNWQRATAILAPITHNAIKGQPPSDDELLYATLDAFQLHISHITPLIEWHNNLHSSSAT